MATRQEVVAAMRAALDALEAETGQPLDVNLSDDDLVSLATNICKRLMPFPIIEEEASEPTQEP